MKNINRRVLILSDHFGHGGVATVCRNLAIGLLRNDFSVHFLSSFVNREEIKIPEGASSSFIKSSSWERKLIIPFVFKLTRYLRRNDFDIIISNKDHVNFYLIFASFFLKKNKIIICNSHSTASEINKHTNWKMYKVILFLCKYLYHKPDVVANVSKASCADSESFFNLKKVHYLPNPVLDDLPVTCVNNPYNTANVINILACGRLSYQKNYPLMLHAFAIAKQQKENLKLTILGSGELESELKTLSIKLGIQDSVDFKGSVNNVKDYMSYADCLWLTSHYEGFGMVLVEALSVGCPIISVDCPFGPKEIIGNSYGKTVDSYDHEINAQALLLFLDEEPKDKAFYQKRALEFSIDKATEQYISVINSVSRNK